MNIIDTKSKSVYDYIASLESYDEYCKILKNCEKGVNSSLSSSIVDAEIALMLSFNVIESTISEGKLQELLNSYVNRNELAILIDRIFKVDITQIYDEEDMRYGITRAELLYLVYVVIPRELGITYNFNTEYSQIKNVLLRYYDEDDMLLENISIIRDNTSDIILDIKKYMHGLSMTEYIKGIMNEDIPVPFPFVLCYAEMLYNEMNNIDMLQGEVSSDTLQVETFSSALILLARATTLI